jgi:5'-phosphate synthase pdxT subunit
VGVLALQGGFAAHIELLQKLGVQGREVRTPADLVDLDGLILPGGESTTMSLGIEREGLAQPLRDFAEQGRPLLGTCAGLIMLDRNHLGLLDIVTRRNAFGRQIHSFETELNLEPLGINQLQAVFIRAPWVEQVGSDIEVLASVDGHPVAVRQTNILAVAFHPELSGEERLHQWILDRIHLVDGNI